MFEAAQSVSFSGQPLSEQVDRFRARPEDLAVTSQLAADAIMRSVLRGMADGLSDREIGRRAHVSDRTVQRLIDQFKQTSGTTNRFAAGAAACRLGFLDAD